MTDSTLEDEPLLGNQNIETDEEGADTDSYTQTAEQDARPPRSVGRRVVEPIPEEPKGVLVSFIRSMFGFNKAPFSLLFVLTYAIILLISSVVQSGDPSVESPPEYPAKYLSNAWMDLQQISREFHPYNSRANDRVHDYILNQVSDITISSSSGHIHHDDDVRHIFFQEPDVFDSSILGRVNYFEGNNILAKVQGADPSLGAVLLSAHYDSVPTAYGTTDDGAGIASMLSILRYYADNSTPQPQRTIIFNFNNNEEFGLLGAEAFFYHPWSKNVTVFLNLEGTGAGGRAILFRSTDYGVAKHYKAASSPHANSIFQQGFSDGLVRSETDYKVYTKNGLRGLDVAFYKPRNLYHTRRDSIKGTSYGALSHMFTNALDVTRSLADAPENDFEESSDDSRPAVFFDILGSYLVVLPLGHLLQFNLIGLIAGPLIIALLLFAVLRSRSWAIGMRGWLRGIVSLVLSVAATISTALWVHDQNELIVVSSFFSPFFLLMAVFLITNYLILSLGSYLSPVPDQKLVIFLESFTLLWSLLVVSTVHISQRKATGEFPLTIVYYLYFFAVVLGLLGMLLTKSDTHKQDVEQPLLTQDSDSEASHGIDAHKSTASKLKHVARQSLSFDWSLQFLVVVPIGFYILYSSGFLTFDALHHNALEGASGAATVYSALTMISVAVGFLVLPFIHRFHVLVAVILLAMLLCGGILSLHSFPLSHEAPMKIRFVQSIDLDGGNGTDGLSQAHVSVLTRTGYGYKVLSDLPSVKSESLPITCKPYGTDDSELCMYQGPRPWVVSNEEPSAAADYNDWLNVTVLRTHQDSKRKRQYKQDPLGTHEEQDDDEDFGPFNGEIYIAAKENRVCNVMFNTTTFSSNDGTPSPVRVVTIYHDKPDQGNLSTVRRLGAEEPEVLKWYKGINDVTVHKLDWNQPGYHLEFQWIPRWYETAEEESPGAPSKRSLGLHITCYWSEYDAESIVGSELKRRIPALDEVLEYSPPWVTWTNWGRGLVEVKKYIEL